MIIYGNLIMKSRKRSASYITYYAIELNFGIAFKLIVDVIHKNMSCVLEISTKLKKRVDFCDAMKYNQSISLTLIIIALWEES